jgi:predicted metal-dependent phosphotriesterase family hydrolase
MNPETLAIISEVAKFGIFVLVAYMKQAGLTDEQIDQVFVDAKKGMLARNPADIPSV